MSDKEQLLAELQRLRRQVAELQEAENRPKQVETEQAHAETEKRVRELNCLNDIGSRMDESLPVEDLLEWVAARIPPAMQHPAHCVVAIEYEKQTYGRPEAKILSYQVVQSLQAGNEVVGRIYVAYTKKHEFLDEESALLGDIARRLSGYIESSRLFQEASSRAQRLALVNRIARVAGAAVNLDELMETVYQEVANIFETDAFFIALYDQDTDELDFRFVVEKGERMFPGRFPVSGLTSWVIEEKKPLVIGDLKEEREDLPLPELIGSGDMAASWMGVPMLAGDRVIGIVSMQSYRSHIWNQEDEQLLFTIVDQITVAVENIRLLEEARIRAQELLVLNEMSRVFSSLRKVDPLVESIYRHLSRLMDTTNFYIALYNSESDEISFPLAVEHGERREWGSRRAGRGLTEYVIRSREPLLIPEDVTGRLEELGMEAIGEIALSWLGVPMIVGGQVMGMIGIQSYTTARSYSKRHCNLLEAIASQAAAAIENIRLLQETQARAEELAVLNELAQSLTARLEVDQVLNEAYRGVSRLLDASNFFIGLYDQEKHEIAFPLNISESKVDEGLTVISADQGISGYIVRNRTSVLVGDDIPGWQQELGLEAVGEAAASWLGVPMMIGDRVVGLMAIQDYTTPGLYDEHDLDMMTAIASQVAVALENARLFEQTQNERAQAELLYQGSDRMSRSTSVQEVLLALVESTALQRLDRVSITFFNRPWEDEMPEEATVVAGWERDGELDVPVGTQYPLAQFPAVEAIAQGEPVIIRDVVTAEWVNETLRSFLLDRLDVRGLVMWPLEIGGQLIGLVNGQAATALEMDEREVRHIDTLTDQAAAVINGLRLFERTQQALEEVQAVHRRYLRESWQDYLSERSVQPAFLYDRARIVEEAEFDLPEIDQALARGQMVVGGDEKEGQPVALPITLRGQSIGALAVEPPEDGRPWSEEELALIEAVAEQLGLALETTRLFEETQMSAHRERTLRQITERVQAASDMEALLKTAAHEIRRVLGASHATIRLGIEGDETA